jgi:hypothetical protein
MSSSVNTATPSTSPYFTSQFWENLWRQSGIHFVLFFVIGYVVYGYQPQIGASGDALAAFYGGERTRILIAAILFGFALINLMWFASAIRTTLADAGRDGWGAAATASSAAFAAMFGILVTLGAAVAYARTVGPGDAALVSGLNNAAWACVVMTSFPRAMLIMSGSFGLWRAGLVSNSFFAAGVAALVLVLLGGTTWMSDGFWAPDGAYSRFVSPAIGVVWVVAVSRVLSRSPATRSGW